MIRTFAAGARRRALQLLALYAPGGQSLRVWLHRMRGVEIGSGVFIGTDALIETSKPELVSIGDRVDIGIRCTIIAHFHGMGDPGRRQDGRTISVRIEDDAFVGPGTIVLPNVTIGRGAVVNAGSVVTRSVPPLTMVAGNPARPIARFDRPLSPLMPIREFYRHLKPIRTAGTAAGSEGARAGKTQAAAPIDA